MKIYNLCYPLFSLPCCLFGKIRHSILDQKKSNEEK